MTTPITKLIEENKERLSRKAVFTDENSKVYITEMPSSSDRLARVTEVLLEGLHQVRTNEGNYSLEAVKGYVLGVIAHATAIAEGKE